MKPERLRELAERLAKAMPERFQFVEDHLDGFWHLRGYQPSREAVFYASDISHWRLWSWIGPLLDELKIDGDSMISVFDMGSRKDTWLETAFLAVIEAAEARR